MIYTGIFVRKKDLYEDNVIILCTLKKLNDLYGDLCKKKKRIYVESIKMEHLQIIIILLFKLYLQVREGGLRKK